MAICSEDYPFEILSTQQCEKNCQIELILTNKCILNFKENEYDINGKKIQSTKIQDIMLRNTEISFTSEEYNTSNLDKGHEEIIQDEKMKITLTTTKHQKNNFNNNNTTAIDIGYCETLLRETNDISDDELLYMRKIEVFQEKMKIPKIEFDIYYKENKNKLKKLNLSICENINIYISYPVNISESLEILNPRSDYYNNICHPATSNKGTDIILADRRNDFIQGNKTICQDGCYLEKYNNINKKSECSCKGKEFLSIINSIGDIKINRKKLFENFIDINNIANIKLMKCYKILFSKDGINNNIAFYSIIPIIILHITSIFIFYICQKKSIHNKINDITYSIKNWHLVTNYGKKNSTNKKFFFNQKGKNIINNNIIKNNIFFNNNEMNKDKNNQNNNKEKKLIKLKQPFDLYYSQSIKKFKKLITNPPIKRKNIMKANKNINSINKMLNIIQTENSNRSIIHKMNEEKIIQKIKKTMEYNDKEMNELTYEQALKYDKRNYIQYYYSLLKTKYILIFSFCTDDYNSKIIKIDFFFISFVVNYTINALFFNDDNMHKIYEDYGEFDIINQLPQIVYSTLISAIFDYFLNMLALSEDDIIEFKKNRQSGNLYKKAKSLINKLNIKFSLFFFIGFLLLLGFWYYLSMFCAIYRNTQYHLIKDTLISYGISLISPLGINLLPGIFRIPSLSDKRNKNSYLFKFSQLLQIF